MSDKRPIGVFDSGLGGLGVVKELRRLLPREDIVYFGDTGRVPYGSKSPETIIKYAKEDVSFLLEHNVKIIVAACGTVSAVALDVIRRDIPIPVFGVVDSAVKVASSATVNGIVAVIGTTATVESGVFEKKLSLYENVERVISRAYPLFVNLVECGFIESGNEITRSVCELYLSDIKQSRADTLILGCTHFPIISNAISNALPGVTLINPSATTARVVAAFIRENGMLSEFGGKTDYYVSDDAASFCAAADIFLGKNEKIKATTTNPK